MLPFRDVIIQLREKFADLTEEQQAQYAATMFWAGSRMQRYVGYY